MSASTENQSNPLVRDTDSVDTAEESVLLTLDKVLETHGAGLLHTLEAHLEVDREVNTGGRMSVNDIEPSEDRAFVISRASAIEPSGFEVVVQLEGLGAPSILF
jgi:hypothetical protein